MIYSRSENLNSPRIIVARPIEWVERCGAEPSRHLKQNKNTSNQTHRNLFGSKLWWKFIHFYRIKIHRNRWKWRYIPMSGAVSVSNSNFAAFRQPCNLRREHRRLHTKKTRSEKSKTNSCALANRVFYWQSVRRTACLSIRHQSAGFQFGQVATHRMRANLKILPFFDGGYTVSYAKRSQSNTIEWFNYSLFIEFQWVFFWFEFLFD